MNKVKLR